MGSRTSRKWQRLIDGAKRKLEQATTPEMVGRLRSSVMIFERMKETGAAFPGEFRLPVKS